MEVEMTVHRLIHTSRFAVFGVACAAALGTLARGDDARPPEARGPVPTGEAVARALAEAWPDRPEWLDMYTDILMGSQLGPNDGWFRRAVAQTRFGWDACRGRYDKDGDGKITRGEFPGSEPDFFRLDRDHDGALTRADFDFSPHALTASPGMIVFYRADLDGNGKVTREELDTFFKRCDSDGLGFLSLSDLQDAFAMPRPPANPPKSQSGGGGPSKETLIRGLFRQEIGSLQAGPSLNEKATDFTLKTTDGTKDMTLSKLIGPKPVVLVFGNFTCGPFRTQAGNVEKLYRMYKDRATFVMVYVREAHPTDGWSMESNQQVGVALAQPRTYQERVSVAQTCGKRLGLGFPMLVDTIDDTVGARYSGMPSRLYLIDSEGKVAYKSGRGPFGFKTAELEQSLILLLQQEKSAKREAERAERPRILTPPRQGDGPIKLLGNDEAWRRLPSTTTGGGQPLPNWARATAHALPRTTAAMLELDGLHRTKSPLGPTLRSMMRWVAADANRCEYSRATAEADLRRAGVGDAAIESLRGGPDRWPVAERAALRFARQMTLDASKVTDDEVSALREAYGEEKLVAMVLLLAAANFQDRLLLSLGTRLEASGPLSPIEVRFAADAASPPVPPRAGLDELRGPPVPAHVDDPEWVALDFDVLQTGLDAQRARPGRIRVPTHDEVMTKLAPDDPRRDSPMRIKWSLVCFGYQPELAAAWSKCMKAFEAEAKLDEVFGESLFWVVTRTIHCFY
jgi:alkylhydroperoxidase family enzyme/thiol-disulfide isomerase/thioredoxin